MVAMQVHLVSGVYSDGNLPHYKVHLALSISFDLVTGIDNLFVDDLLSQSVIWYV